MEAKMKRSVSILVGVVLLTAVAFAQDGGKKKDKDSAKAAKAEKVTMKGYLMDKMCASGHMDDLATMSPEHTTACALKCAPTGDGLGVVSEGKFYAFDAKGAKKAMSLAKKSKTEKGLMVEVTGTVNGDQFMVSSIQEVKTAAPATT
jgi:hypothetical protein